jgi:hypothetical protein
MTPLDDAALRSQLERRATSARSLTAVDAGPTDRARRLATSIVQAVAAEPQASGMPWRSLRAPRVLRPVANRTPLVAGAALSWILVVALAAASLPGLLARPAPAASPGAAAEWYLTSDQLQRVVSGAAASGANVGKTIVANVQITGLPQNCPIGSCGYDTFIAGIEPRIPVTDAELPAACPAPPQGGCHGPLPPPGPTALTIEPGSVKFVATLTTRGLSPERIAFTVAEALLNRPDGDYVVKGWLWDIGSPPCALPLPGTFKESDYGCGDAAWLTDEPPTTATAPLTALRVQNGVLPDLAPNPSALGTDDPRAAQGTYLVAATPTPPDCVQCPGGVGRLLQPIDTVSIPPESLPDPALPSPSVTDPTDLPSQASTGIESWLVDLNTLNADVTLAARGDGSGRVVIADVGYALVGESLGVPVTNPDDAGPPDCAADGTSCSVVVRGSDPPIRVLDTWRASDCAHGQSCTFTSPVFVPRAGPAALRLRADGGVDFIDYVVTPPSGMVLTGGDAAALITGMQADNLDSARLYVLTGWLSEWSFEPKCVLVSSIPAFGCGRPAWISDAEPQATDVAASPANATRVQNQAYERFAPPSPGLPAALGPRQGVFLVRPVVPTPGGCFECNSAAAEIIARLDPPVTATDATSTASPIPEPAATIEASAASAAAVRFEGARAAGHWSDAWALLGQATRSVFGSLPRFASVEAAFNATGGTVYDIAAQTRNVDFMAEAYVGPAVWADIEPDTAWFIAVNHPDVDGASAGLEGLLVASGLDGVTHVWIVH